ncbi:class I SAM-dependent methyltransferase [Aestuariicoccus sp. MJ-SS9]|uniref:class I SAM-dependent DNA methyltransferase n=1 Tax=Aestuariicoccus sp. MJ-SS9 TaxID=3079855 RepID=UPI00290F891A|nr:class I SAM-dependent methyltransferase [Aestuariicoccus sp. MJ-SS9]MDU8912753.1 class I SAM-dependent methyltransferase [Aestuariicoccus sp. MJ-SS9]
MTDPETIRVYDARAGEYAALTGRDGPDRTLADFIARVVPGGRVLDLGCGPGGSARHMAAAGLQVEAWDASAEMVALAARQPGVAARQAVFDDLTAIAAYDAIWANFSLLHAPRADIPRHLSAIARALRPGGLFHIAVKEGKGEARDALGRGYTYFTEAGLTRLLQDAGLTPGPFKRGVDKGLSGSMDPWISVTAHG